MKDEGYEAVTTDPVFRAVRNVLPWIALAVVVWVLMGAWGGFTRSKDLAEAQKGETPSVTVTSTAAPSTATTVTGMVAVPRVAVTLRSDPDTKSEELATAKKGATLTILAKQGTYFRVRDKAGHIGWVANDSAIIEVRKK